jgi:hypothetical protein
MGATVLLIRHLPSLQTFKCVTLRIDGREAVVDRFLVVFPEGFDEGFYSYKQSVSPLNDRMGHDHSLFSFTPLTPSVLCCPDRSGKPEEAKRTSSDAQPYINRQRTPFLTPMRLFRHHCCRSLVLMGMEFPETARPGLMTPTATWR